jgi:hypothetical protein
MVEINIWVLLSLILGFVLVCWRYWVCRKNVAASNDIAEASLAMVHELNARLHNLKKENEAYERHIEIAERALIEKDENIKQYEDANVI